MKLPRKKMTARQAEVFNFIKSFQEKEGWPPTRKEIAAHFGFRSLNAAEDHIKALAKKGYLTTLTGRARGIKLNLAAFEAPNAQPTAVEVSEETPNLAVPILGQVAAGSPTLAAENLAGEINLVKHTFAEQPDFFLQVKGLSMLHAGILEDDLLAVKKTNELPKNGQLVVARLGDEVTVKRFKKRGNQVTLQAENPDYPNIKVNLAVDELVIEGLAVGLLRQGV